MPVFARQQDQVLVITVDGDYTSQEMRRVGEKALQSPETPKPARVLVDMSGAAGLARKGLQDIQATAGFFADMGSELGPVAVLAPVDVAAPLLGMAEAFFRSKGLAAKVVQDRQAAMNWLAPQ